MVLQGMRPKLDGSFPSWLAPTLHRCWAEDPEARPSFEALAELFKQHALESERRGGLELEQRGGDGGGGGGGGGGMTSPVGGMASPVGIEALAGAVVRLSVEALAGAVSAPPSDAPGAMLAAGSWGSTREAPAQSSPPAGSPGRPGVRGGGGGCSPELAAQGQGQGQAQAQAQAQGGASAFQSSTGSGSQSSSGAQTLAAAREGSVTGSINDNQ
jgi:hypothetical protein